MKPGTSVQNLLYVSAINGDSGVVYVYSYPQGERVGSLGGFIGPTGECVDAAGDIFIIAYANNSLNSSTIYEYAHGGTTPIAALNDPGGGAGCAFDATTGNLAVANAGDEQNPYGSQYGDIAIFVGARGNPKMYYSPELELGTCAYDGRGNLYLQSYNQATEEFGLARLSAGKKSIDPISIDVTIYEGAFFAPTVRWDGQHITITSLHSKLAGSHVVALYRFRVSGKSATVIGTTSLKSDRHNGVVGESWIYDDAVVAAVAGPAYGRVSYWQYPSGGKPTYTIKRVTEIGKALPWAVTISPAQSR